MSACRICFGKGVIEGAKCPGCNGRKTTSTTLGEIASTRAKHSAANEPTTVLRFVVPGEPVGKERARVFRHKSPEGRVITRAVTPEKTREYEDKVRTLAQIAVNQARWAWSKDDRFSVVMKVYRTHWDAGGDLDNIVKTLDALNGIVWKDDRYVRGIGAAFQEPDPKNPRVEVEIRRFRKGAA